MDSTNYKDISNKDQTVYRVYLDKELGKGQFGKVYKAKLAPGQSDSNQDLAVKMISKKTLLEMGRTPEEKGKYVERLKSEVETWKKGSHPNIVKFLDFIETQNSCYLVSEFCDGPTLERLLIEKGKTEEKTAVGWFQGLASAVAYLHENKIIHRDIKPGNVIFKEGVPKIVDFGFAKELQQGQVQTVGIGSPKYMAPELLEQRDDYDAKVDIWALGWTFYEVIYGNDPWPIDNVRSMADLLGQIASRELKFQKNPKVSDKVKQMITGMLELEPEDRFDSEKLKQAADSLRSLDLH